MATRANKTCSQMGPDPMLMYINTYTYFLDISIKKFQIIAIIQHNLAFYNDINQMYDQISIFFKNQQTVLNKKYLLYCISFFHFFLTSVHCLEI